MTKGSFRTHMTQLNIPVSFTDISRSWISNALEDAFNGIGERLQDVRVEEIGAGYGLMASLYRCFLEYSGSQGSFPQSVVLKLTSTDSASLRLAKSLDLYQREYDFYKKIQPTASIRAPILYYGAFDKKSNQFVLVLEDLCYLKAYNQLDGATPEQAIVAIAAIAKLHSQYWKNRDSKEFADAYKAITPLNAAAVHFVFRSNIDSSIRKFPQFFSPHLESVVNAFGRRVTELMIVSGESDVTFCHGDYRLDNMFFGDDGEFAVIDWQVSGLAGGSFDVAYFLTGSLTPETRKLVERDAIQTYCNVVEAESGIVVTFEEAWDFYRQGVLSCLLTAIIVSGSLDLSIDRSNELVIEGLQRTLLAIEELQADEFLGIKPNKFTMASFANAFVNLAYDTYGLFRRTKEQRTT